MGLSFTIVVCTRNRCGELRRLLDNLAEEVVQSTSTWDVLVVDNGSTDDTRSVVADVARTFPVPLRVALEPELGIAHARNRGVNEATGDVLVYLDDDVTVRQGWFKAVESEFSDPATDAAGGPVFPHFPRNAPSDYIRAVMGDRCGSTGLYDLGSDPLKLSPELGAPHGANMALRTSLLEKVGRFQTSLGWGREQLPGEETDLFVRCFRLGASVRYSPSMAVDHFLQADKVGWDYLRRWHIGYGRASVRMRPRPPAWLLAAKLVEQSLAYLRYSLATRFDRSKSSARPYRKAWQAQGRIAELLGR
jgi:glycosyltransferase involved in cell wall biosynthesis